MINFDGFIITTVINREEKAFKEFSSKVMGFCDSKKSEITSFDDFSSILASELSSLKITDNFTMLEKYRSIVVIKNQSKMKPSSIFRWMRERNIKFRNIMRVFPLDLIVKTSNIVIGDDKNTDAITESTNKNLIIDKNSDVATESNDVKDDLNLICNLVDNYHFKTTYKILFEGRLCPDLKKRVFEIVIPRIKAKVDLVSPDDLVLVQAFKYYVGFCILKNDANNFNFCENFTPKSKNNN